MDSSARIRRERRDYLGGDARDEGEKYKRSGRKRHIKGELCGRARERVRECSWELLLVN